MSGKVCKCGQVLLNVEYPNDLEWTIYDKNEFEYWIGDEYSELTEEKKVFDYFWLCPKCKRAHVWLNSNGKHCEFRLYEYRETDADEKIDINNMREIYVISACDEDSFDENITIKEIMNLHLHDHRYFVTEDEKIVYLYNVKTELLDEKYIIKYSDNDITNDDKIYYYLTVKYEEHYSNKEYNYISDDTSVKVGDRVLVDMAGELVIADVLETAFYDKFEAPFPVHKTKRIIKKVDDDFDIDDIEFYDEENDNLPYNVLYMNIDDTNFELGIFDYVRGENNDDNWANLIVKVKNKNFNYLRNAELMTSAEVERLLNGLQKLLNDELKEKEVIGFYEPDLEFDLYPRMNLWDTGDYSYIKEGYEIQDIYVEFTINLTDREGTYTGQKYVMIFDRENIEKIVEYMKKIVE